MTCERTDGVCGMRRRKPSLARRRATATAAAHGERDTAHVGEEYTASAYEDSHARVKVLTAIVAAGIVVVIAGAAAQQSNFMGGTPAQLDAKAVRTLRLKFPAGSRSNWHSHSHGQLLMIEEGWAARRTATARCSKCCLACRVTPRPASSTGTAPRPIRTGPADDLRRRSQVAGAGHRRRLQGGAEEVSHYDVSSGARDSRIGRVPGLNPKRVTLDERRHDHRQIQSHHAGGQHAGRRAQRRLLRIRPSATARRRSARACSIAAR